MALKLKRNELAASQGFFPAGARRLSQHRGFSLIELMIALTIGLLITGALANVMLASRVTYQADEGLSRLQENGRMAIELITREVRSAGFIGCLQNNPLATVYNNLNGGAFINLRTAIQGFEATGTGPGITLTPTAPTAVTAAGWAPALDTNLVTLDLGSGPGAVAGTDVLAIRRASATGFPLVAPFPSSGPSGSLNINSTVDPAAAAQLSAGQIAVVSDCRQASIFQITAATPGAGVVNIAHAGVGGFLPGNDCATWNLDATCAAGKQSYSSNARMYTAEAVVFFIGIDFANNSTPTLYRGTVTTSGGTTARIQAQPLVAGIENMQVLYGVDDNADRVPDRIMTASQVNAGGLWPLVVSVNVGLLARSDNIEGQADTEPTNQRYLLTGTSATTGTNVRTSGYADRRWRRAFNTTITIRNRGV